MLRIFVCGAVVWVLSALGVARPVFAQGKNAGCDGAVVVVKAGRSRPCTKLAREIAGLLEGPEVSRERVVCVVVGVPGWGDGDEGGEWRCCGRRYAVSVGAVSAGLVDRRYGLGIWSADVGVDD